jgi:anti-sigma factor RsiW
MVERSAFTDEQIQDYIDGRLSERDRATVAAYLLAHPRVAADVDAVRRQSEALRALGQEVLDEPVPEHLRRILRTRRTPPSRDVESATASGWRAGLPAGAALSRNSVRLAMSAATRRLPSLHEVVAAIALVCAGGVIGWFGHALTRPAPSADDVLLAEMSHAYAFYGARDYPVAFPPDRAEEFVAWIGRSFEREVRPPDLAAFGYRYRGGRVIPSAGGNIGLFQFERPDDAELAVFFWATSAPPKVAHAEYDRDHLAAHVLTTDGLSFAVIGDKADRDLATAAAAVFAFLQ